MSLVSILASVDWLATAEKATTVAESLLPLLLKAALDGSKVASGDPAAIMALIADIEAGIHAYEAAMKANNTEIAHA